MRYHAWLLVAAVTGAFMAAPAAAGELEMILDSAPSGARVEQGGKVLGQTPLRLTYPTGYFASRSTVWGAFLGAPLEFTLTAPGYEPKTVRLGNGPQPWRNLYGQIVYQYYLLDRAYRIELTQLGATTAATAPPGQSADTVGQLERLATLRNQGVLTEEEFSAAKARVLAGGAPPADATSAAPKAPANPLDDQDPTTLCWRLISGTFEGAQAARLARPTRQSSTAIDGSQREVRVSCAWEVPAPQPTTLKVDASCADGADLMALCRKGELPVTSGTGEPACSWSTELTADVVTRSGCTLHAALVPVARHDLPPGFNPPSGIDLGQLVRTMTSRVGGSAVVRSAITTPAAPAALQEARWYTLDAPPAAQPIEECPVRIQIDLGPLFAAQRKGSVRPIYGSWLRCAGASFSNLVVQRSGQALRDIVVESEIHLDAGRDKLALLALRLLQGGTVLAQGQGAVPLGNNDVNWEDPVKMLLLHLPAPPPEPAPVLQIEMRVEAP